VKGNEPAFAPSPALRSAAYAHDTPRHSPPSTALAHRAWTKAPANLTQESRRLGWHAVKQVLATRIARHPLSAVRHTDRLRRATTRCRKVLSRSGAASVAAIDIPPAFSATAQREID
jgi:hypothetical protein